MRHLWALSSTLRTQQRSARIGQSSLGQQSSCTWTMCKSIVLSIIFIILFVHLDGEVYQDRPKIKTSDGDLFLKPAYDKSIYLSPNGPESKIYVGNIDLLQTNISRDTGQFVPSTNADVDRILNGPNGVLRRLEMLENKDSNRPNSTLFDIFELRRRVDNLHRKVISLQTRLSLRETDKCSSNPCEHGGTCLNLIDGHHCLCPSNWEGRDCDIDVNECRNYAGTDLGCQNGATCINRPGSYECLCRSGWFGLHCTKKEKDCSGGDFEMCGHGMCIPVTTGNGIKCICQQGWTTNGTDIACITDVNECEESQGPRCSVNPRVECINLPGSFRCGQCPIGYTGDGYVCHDIDECTTLPNGGCSTMVSCHNTIGSRICGTCPAGYVGDGVTCTWSGSCRINRGGCHPSAKCIDNLRYGGQSVQCVCPEGMAGDGVGPLGCYIAAGNFTEGCESSPCGTHGRCHPLRTGYICLCYRGYSGSHCNIARNSCSGNSCFNGGSCIPDDTLPRGYRCECTARYTGTFCQISIKRCGGVLDNEEGVILYPITNTTYDNNAICAWVIHTSPDKVINVTFTKFNLEKDDSCSSDFLQIHDGRSSASQFIGRFCGNIFPKGGNVISSHNNLYLWFRSDASISKDGFALHWTSIKPFCGGEIDATTHGIISSPGSPGSYPPKRDCYWHLITTLGKRIQLHSFELDIETHPNCSFDYLAIYDGEHETDPLLNKYCNSTQPTPVQSAGSDMLIHFHSDEYGNGKGFQIGYALIEGIPGCGGYYTAEQGELTSPTYNGNYLNNLLCEYKIKTAPETKIKLDFKYFKLEQSRRCEFDYLKVYDGASADSQLVGRFCGSAYPKSYISSSNVLYFKFKTDHSLSSGGFKITYESICRISLRGDSGIIKSPGYPFRYPENKQCEYVISTIPGKAIQLTFQDFDLEESSYYNCTYDYIEIYDGQDRNSSLLGKFCGGTSRTPPVQTSTLNYMYIRFNSDMSLSGTGFYANYTTIDTKCGGVHTNRTGLIQYPAENKISEHDQTCTWLVIAPQGMHIKLNWNRFDIENMPYCQSDYVAITEIDENNENTLLGKFCGNNAPAALTTSTNRLKVVYESDSSVRSVGFSVSYTFLDEKSHCGGISIKSHGFIYSPGWPKKYEPNRDCIWVITVPVGQQIVLNISQFDLERPIRDKCNLGDYLEIRNGASHTSPLIGQFCGNFRNRRIISMAHIIYLHFHSGFYLTGNGFKIEWDGTVTGCGGTLTSSSGTITSPNYPNNYNENSECFYKIVTSLGSRIRISFTDLELENDINCKNDYVEIFDGRNTGATSFGKYCSMSPSLHNIETSSNYAFIKFRSDFYLEHKGFMLTYDTLCNNNLTERYGVIESPDFPGNYPLHLDCLWTIKAPKGNRINVTFSNFNLYDTRIRGIYWSRHLSNVTTCSHAYVQTKDISDVNFLDKLCGNILPAAVSSKGNSLQIKFVTRGSISRSGFRLEWVIYGCGGHIQKSRGSINLDKILASRDQLECEWLVETPLGTSVHITFLKLYMSDTANCTLDAIEVFNGQDSKSPLLLRACHHDSVWIQSTTNYMFIRFYKSSTLKDVHFKADFYSPRATCGGYMESLSGYIYSKNYPKDYDKNMDCMWTISVPLNHRILLNFMDFDLYSNDESNDEDDGCINTNYTYRICPKSKITQITTKRNKMVVQFTTNGSGRAKGFKANFTAICGATIIALYDGIISNDKSISYTNSCIWTVKAPTLNQKISLTISHMSLKNNIDVTNRTCPTNYLRVYDGDDTNAPLFDEYCGRKAPPMIVSHGNAITIELGSYVNIINGLFTAHYSPLINACGGTLASEEGIIVSPNYPLSYPRNSDCEWILSTSPGNKVYIMFERFSIKYSDGCNEDYLEIRENNGMGSILGVYCGSEIPTNTSAASTIYIKFHSSDGDTGEGFVIHYEFLHGNEITGNNGIIASPLFPHRYQGAGEYTWRIITEWSSIISVTFEEFEIVAHSDVCKNKLSIYDGYDDTGILITNLCGILKEDRTTYHSSSNVMYIKLSLDDTNTGSLFYLTWTNNQKNEIDIISGEKFNCGLNQTKIILPGMSSIFESPNYPNDYDNEQNCQWIFKTFSGRHLTVVFTDFNIEDTSDCFADSVSVYKAHDPNQWDPITKDICITDTIKDKVLNGSELVKVTFKTDHSVVRRGFQGKVSSLCGGLVTNSSGEISAVWADVYLQFKYRIKCEWTVKVRAGKRIKFKFSHFNISNTNDNCETYVVLRNGESVESPLLGRYCGYDHENRDAKVTSGSALYISFTSIKGRYAGVFKTFKIYYEEKGVECGSTSVLSFDHQWEIINSPNYPSVPDAYSECVWIFTAPPGEIIRIEFIDRFDLDNVDDCANEAVEIHDGRSEFSRILGRFCSDRPGTIKTTNNVVYVKYMTEIVEPRDGFKANISIDICGGTITANRGEITSPNYPHMPVLAVGTVCEWRVLGGLRSIMTILPQEINLPNSVSPCENKITIEEYIPSNKSNVLLQTFCNDNVEATYTRVETSTNQVIIKLHIGRPSEWTQTSEHRGFRFTFNSSRPACGGIISVSEGYLTTPSYPFETTVRYCQWFITVPDKKRRVRLELIDADFEKHKLRLFNDLSFQSAILMTVDTTYLQTTRVLESSGNKMAVFVWMNLGQIRHRFKARFSSDDPSLCGEDLRGLTGNLKAPNVNQSYTCEWKYVDEISPYNTTYEYNTMYLSATVNTSTHRSKCQYSDPKLVIEYQINKIRTTFRRSLCGVADESFVIPSSSITLKSFKSNNFSIDFEVSWKLQPCGGVQYVGNVPVNILDLPNGYNDTLDCAWSITIPIDSRVELKFDGSFEADCDDEYVKILPGFSPNAPLIGDYCKSKVMENALIINFRMLYIQYHSKAKAHTNIKLMARTITEECGGYLNNHQHVFASPNYPKSYKPNEECVWEIVADLGNRVSLEFIDRFIIEDRPNCTKDALIVFDWKNDQYTEIARLCGRQLPPALQSTQQRMKVVLRTDADTNLDGFKALWTPICGGTYTATDKEQILYSPGYPFEYSPLMNCTYVIKSDKRIKLKFLEFELEGTYPECTYDNVSIHAEGQYFMDVSCGDRIPDQITSFDKIQLTFKSDKYIQRKGFKIVYSIYNCGGHISNATVLHSNPDADHYDTNLDCKWYIEAPENMIVVVKFLYIDIEGSSDCYSDYVSIFDGLAVENEKRLALLCGHMNTTTTIRSKNNTMLLQFVADSSISYRGFKAAVIFTYSKSVGCGGEVDMTTTNSFILKSPLLKGSVVYENYLDCLWVIKSSPGTVIQIEFKTFHISSCQAINQTAIGFNKCECDLVEVIDGLNPNSLVIGTYCGHTIPPQLLSSRNVMSVRLSTDGDIPSSGFEAQITTRPSVCGQIYYSTTQNTQRIRSPRYESGTIPRGLHCIYHLDANSVIYTTIRLTVDIDLSPETPDSTGVKKCNNDRFIITSNPASLNTTAGKDLVLSSAGNDFFSASFFYDMNTRWPSRFEFCGHKKLELYFYGSVNINLLTSPDTVTSQYKGVDIQFVYVGFCSRNYTEPHGRIQSSYVSHNDHSEHSCYTLITAQENYTISLYFLAVTPNYWDQECYLQIFDGNDTKSKELIKIQGSYDYNYPIFSSGRYLLLHNHENANNRLTYDLSYVTTDKGPGCGGKLVNELGRVTSPLYPSVYRHLARCEWELETPVGTKVMLRFSVFDLGPNCDQNYLMIVNSNGESISTYCSESPADFTSQDNYIKIVFITTTNNGGSGWVADFIGIL
ncbi:hypothetical protein K1T71_007504 [Dendrolimus kikuchii]|uniref:Uncharacterized protein n=1 Tax=Dendrolimus kikuchii TaxID=765133 RepID=A0ACC1D0T4_9NEOP|nr:hypothetical protein K1T71_007504 [Dendrolimus kikuchii]